VIGAIRAEADERPAVGRGHDTPAQAGVERNDTAGGNAAIERRDGELERRGATDGGERPGEAAHAPNAGAAARGHRTTADSETGSRNQVFERFLQAVGQTKVPTVFFVLMVLVVLFLQVWSATSLSTMSTRSIVGGAYGLRRAPSLLSMGPRSFHPDRVDQLAGPEGLGAAVIDVAHVVHWLLEIAVLEQGPARTRPAVAADGAGIQAGRSGLFEIHDALEERVPTLLERALPEVVADRRHHHAGGQSAVGIDVEAVQACSALEHVLTAPGVDPLPCLVDHVLI